MNNSSTLDNPNVIDKRGETPLIIAVKNGDIKLINSLLEHGADPNMTGRDGKTPLMKAAFRNYNEIIRILLEHGANPNIQDPSGDTALIIASEEGHEEVIKTLLQYGADPNIKDFDDGDALYYSIENNNIEIVRLLLQHGSKIYNGEQEAQSDLATALENDRLDIAKLLLEHGADPNVYYEDGDLLLVSAIKDGNNEAAMLLIEHGADVNEDVNEDGDTINNVLARAVKKGNIEIVKALLEHGADPNVNYNDKHEREEYPILLYAVKENSTEIVKLLLEHGAVPNDSSSLTGPALTTAINNNNAEIVKLLLEHGADPNTVSNERYSALAHALDNEDIEIIRLLILYGADITDEDYEDAEQRGIDIFSFVDFDNFISTVININPKDTFGKNYLMLKPRYRRKFIKFIHDWSDYCADPHKELHPAYIKFIAQMLGLEIEGLAEEEMCSMIKDTLQEYLRRLEDLDYSKFKDTEPISREEFTEFRPIDLLQYGNPIEGKYRGLPTEYIDESLDKTEIVDPIDRSDLMNKRSNIINGNVYQDYLLRKMIPENMLEESRVLVKPEVLEEEEQVETLADRLSRFSVPELITFINRLNPNRRQRLPTNLSKSFYVTMLLQNVNRFNEIPQLSELI